MIRPVVVHFVETARIVGRLVGGVIVHAVEPRTTIRDFDPGPAPSPAPPAPRGEGSPR